MCTVMSGGSAAGDPVSASAVSPRWESILKTDRTYSRFPDNPETFSPECPEGDRRADHDTGALDIISRRSVSRSLLQLEATPEDCRHSRQAAID